MKLFINIVVKRIYLFYTVAWNCRKKKGFPVCKKENSPAFKRTGSAEKLSCQSIRHWWNRQKPGQHSLTSVERPLNLRSDFVNVWRHARLVVYIMYAYLMGSWCFCFDRVLICLMIWRFVPWTCLAFLIIPRLIQTRRCHSPLLKDVLKFQASSCFAG